MIHAARLRAPAALRAQTPASGDNAARSRFVVKNMSEENLGTATRLWQWLTRVMTFERLWKIGVLLALLWIASELAYLNEVLADDACGPDEETLQTRTGVAPLALARRAPL